MVQQSVVSGVGSPLRAFCAPVRTSLRFFKLITEQRRLVRGCCRPKRVAVRESSGQLVASEVEGGGEVLSGRSAWASLISLVSCADEGQQSSEDVLLILKALKLAADAFDQEKKEALPCGRLRLQKSLSVASLLIAIRHQSTLVDAETIAASIVAMEVLSGKLSVSAVDSALGPAIASTVASFSDLHSVVDQIEIIDDASARTIKDMFMTSNQKSMIVSIGFVWDDLRRCNLLPLHRQQQIALEASFLYAPVAHAIGLQETAREMDHISLRTLFPESYDSTRLWLEQKTHTGRSCLAGIKAAVKNSILNDECLSQMIEKVEVHDRVKTLDSFMRKLLNFQNTMKGGHRKEDIFDALGLRVVVHPKRELANAEAMAVKACYLILELLHDFWSPVHGRTKDYIVRPKSNGYQSLHTTLILNEVNGDTLELEPDSSSFLSADHQDILISDVHGAICESASSCLGFDDHDATGVDRETVADTRRSESVDNMEHQRGCVIENPVEVFEVQIRTAAMDHRCHFGSSAHPFYKSGMSPRFISDEQKVVRWLDSPEASSKLLKE